MTDMTAHLTPHGRPGRRQAPQVVGLLQAAGRTGRLRVRDAVETGKAKLADRVGLGSIMAEPTASERWGA